MKKCLLVILGVIFSGSIFAGTITPKLQEIMQNSRDSELIPVIVSLKADLQPENAINDFLSLRDSRSNAVAILKKRAEAYQKDIHQFLSEESSRGRAQVVRSFWLINALYVKADRELIRKLANRNDVAEICWSQKTKRINPIRPKPKTNNRVIDKTSLEFVNADIAADEDDGYFITGFQIKVAVLDTGLSDDQVDRFFEVDEASDSFVEGEDFVNDLEGHGTHTAGIVGSDDFGVAKDCTLLAVKVLDQEGLGFDVDIIAGIEHSVLNDANIINMSLGGPVSPEGKPLELSVKAATKLGVIVVAAAGNSGPDPKTIESPGNVKEAFSVGAISHIDSVDALPGFIAFFSSRGPGGPDFCCPGVDIPSLALDPADDPLILSGTSEATPHVAGICAMYLEALFFFAEGNNKLIAKLSSTKTIEKILIKEASHGSAVKNVTGSGYVDALSAVVAVLRNTGELDNEIAAKMKQFKERKRSLLRERRK